MYDVEVTIESGKNLKNVNWKNGPLRPYVVAWVDPSAKVTTNADPENDEDPMWNERLVVTLHGDVDDGVLHFDVVHAVDADQDVEEVKPLVGSGKLPLREVLEEGGTMEKKVKLKRPSGRPHGKITVRVCVRERSGYDRSYPPPASQYGYGAPPPPQQYGYGAPPPPQQYGYGAPPQPQQYGYGAPPPQEYGYGAPPPQEHGYGAPPPQEYGYGAPQPSEYGQQKVVEEEKKKSKFGGMAGIGAGVAVGAGVGLLGGYALAQALDGSDDEEKEEEEAEEEEEAAEEAAEEEEDE